MRWFTWIGMLVVGLLISGCAASAPDVAVNDPWVRAAVVTGMNAAGTSATPEPTAGNMQGMEGHGSAPSGGTSAAYFTLVNSGGSDERLIAVQSDVAETVELHETTMTDNVMRMAEIAGGIVVPANGSTELKPGGKHVMLIGLKRDLVDGESITLTLQFERSGSVTLVAPVRMP